MISWASPYETTEFASRQIEHSLQSTYAAQVDQDSDIYDYVIFGPSELAIQADNIDKLAAQRRFQRPIVWAFHTPLQGPRKTSRHVWFDFSSAAGALTMCDYMLERLGNGVTYGHEPRHSGYHGQPALWRLGKDCVDGKGRLGRSLTNTMANISREGGYEGTQPDPAGLPGGYRSSTTPTLPWRWARVEAQIAVGKRKGSVFSTGWGGTGLELDAIRRGELDATPMRMGDDVGAATAEAIRYHLEGRGDELPFVFLGRITVAHDGMSDEELDALQAEAFRFSGVGALER